MKVHIDKTGYESKPTEHMSNIKPRTQSEKNIVDVALEFIIGEIKNGKSISPAVMVGGCKAENWTEQQLFMVDIDNEADEALLTVDDAFKICADNAINPAFVYHSYSHTESKPKYRLGFVMDEVIREEHRRKIIIETLISLFNQADKACKNADRTFFGTNKDVIFCNENSTITYEDINRAYKPPHKRQEEKTDANKNYQTEGTIYEGQGRDNNLASCVGKWITTGTKDYHELMSMAIPHTKQRHTPPLDGKDVERIVKSILNKNSREAKKIKAPPLELETAEEVNRIRESIENLTCGNIDFKNWTSRVDKHKIPWLMVKEVDSSGEVCFIVIPQALAEHIRKNSRYIFVRNTATDGVIRYWYGDGYYKQISDDELKGYIKEHIPHDLTKIKDINEVFNLLITDLNFVPIDELNADENIINFQNGLLHLGTMDLKSHTPEIYSTIQIPCKYNPDALPSNERHFDKFINHLTTDNSEVKSLLLQFMGVAISNISGWRMKKALFMVGVGDTGKSQLKELTHKLVGANNCSGIDLETLEQRFGTSRIFNKRLIGSSDMSYATVNELKAFKSITGGDTLSAEFKGRNPFNFIFNGLAWFCCNKLPKFGGDRGEWVYNRIVVCECNNPVPKKDKYLQDKMFTESEYIVSLAIGELQKVIRNDYDFIIPSKMQSAVDKYKVTNNSFLQFLEECTTERPFKKISDSCTKARLFEVYKAWCKDNNRGYYESKKDVKETLEGLNMADEIKTNGKRYFTQFTLTVEAKNEYLSAYGYDSVTSN